MTQEYWFEKDPRIKAIYDQAGEEEKELMRVTEQIIRSKSKQWQDKFARLQAEGEAMGVKSLNFRSKE